MITEDKNTQHYPNPWNYRVWLGKEANEALIKLAMKKNADALKPLPVQAYILKMIAHWWKQEYPDTPVPFDVKRYDADLDFVQSG